MELNNVRQLYDYNRWADRRILTVASILARYSRSHSERRVDLVGTLAGTIT
jgi:uncharacterized damage-inducible protein DinB